jgi:hypothetical protein
VFLRPLTHDGVCVTGADVGILGRQDTGQLELVGAPTWAAFGSARQVFTLGGAKLNAAQALHLTEPSR